jgi:hypothetical protein
LLDYESEWSELEASQNVFATVVMTHLKEQETKRDPNTRKQWKLTLIKRLYERGYDRSAILGLFRFVDWLLILPEDYKLAFWEELKIYEEKRQMPYITSVEEIGYDRGVRFGEETGRRSLILRLLTRKVGLIDDQTNDRISNLSIVKLESLGEALLDFRSIDDLTTWLQESVK